MFYFVFASVDKAFLEIKSDKTFWHHLFDQLAFVSSLAFEGQSPSVHSASIMVWQDKEDSIFDFIKWLGLRVLVEIHVYYTICSC